MKHLLLTTTISLGLAMPAFAGGVDIVPEPQVAVVAPAAQGVSWTGFYAGGALSFDGGNAEGFVNDVSVNTTDLDAVTAYGVFAGYNKQVNSMVFGGEVAYTTGDIMLVGYPSNLYTDRVDLKARAGFSLSRAMVYGVVGYSFANFVDLGSDVYPSKGLNFGAGVDVMVTDRIFVGAEYLVRNLSGIGNLNPQNRTDSSLSSASIRVGMKF